VKTVRERSRSPAAPALHRLKTAIYDDSDHVIQTQIEDFEPPGRRLPMEFPNFRFRARRSERSSLGEQRAIEGLERQLNGSWSLGNSNSARNHYGGQVGHVGSGQTTNGAMSSYSSTGESTTTESELDPFEPAPTFADDVSAGRSSEVVPFIKSSTWSKLNLHPDPHGTFQEIPSENEFERNLLEFRPVQARDSLPYRRESLRGLAVSFVSDRFVQGFSGIIVVISSIVMGLDTDFQARHPGQHPPAVYQQMDQAFTIFFTAELALRLYAFQNLYFAMPGWAWNTFDFCLVILQLLSSILCYTNDFNLDFMIILRLMRLTRVARLIRTVRLVEELRTMVASISASTKNLAWTIVLLMGLIYCVAVCITEVVSITDTSKHPEVAPWWGSLDRAILTLFESIAGGLSWDEAARPLNDHVSPIMLGIFCAYIAFAIFALLNVVTGFFVNEAVMRAQEDKDKYLANHISDLFFKQHVDEEEEEDAAITWETFQEKLASADMQEYFKAINVDISEAEGFFALLDVDGNGSVDPEEVVSGLLRLRGQAKAIELSLLSKQTRIMFDKLAEHQVWVQDTLLQALSLDEHQGIRRSFSVNSDVLDAQTPTTAPAGNATGSSSAPVGRRLRHQNSANSLTSGAFPSGSSSAANSTNNSKKRSSYWTH